MVPTIAPIFRRYNCNYTDDGFLIDDDNCDVPFWISRVGVDVL